MADEVIFVVEDDDAVRESIEALLETAGYRSAAFASGTAFLQALKMTSGSCVVLDVKMPGMDGLEVQQRLNESDASLPVVFVTGHGDVTMAVKAMRAGAVDFIEKPIYRERLLASVARAVDIGESLLRDEEEKSEVVTRINSLTVRERQVLEQLIAGQSNKEAARHLGISHRTVEIYRRNVMDKTRARSLSHLVRMALIAGIDPVGKQAP